MLNRINPPATVARSRAGGRRRRSERNVRYEARIVPNGTSGAVDRNTTRRKFGSTFGPLPTLPTVPSSSYRTRCFPCPIGWAERRDDPRLLCRLCVPVFHLVRTPAPPRTWPGRRRRRRVRAGSRSIPSGGSALVSHGQSRLLWTPLLLLYFLSPKLPRVSPLSSLKLRSTLSSSSL
jgi:hypothetical protein